MGNRRELMLRLVQALGIAWVLLALLFYFVLRRLTGRGVSVLSVLIVLVSLLTWRILIHYLTGHPKIGERILIVGTGPATQETTEGFGGTILAYDETDKSPNSLVSPPKFRAEN
jgi:FlaA1/EpsC-like NDP-sugar epimerase